MSKSVLSAAFNLDIAGLGKAILADLTALRAKIAALVVDVTAIRARQNLAMLSPAGLAIGGGSKYTAQAVKPCTALVAGTLVFLPAATAMSALVGTLATAKFALWAFYVNASGTITTSAKTADAASAAAAFALMPAVPANLVQIGFIIVGNATGGNFVGGSTALDAASVTTIYVDTVGTQTAPVALTSSAPAALETIT